MNGVSDKSNLSNVEPLTDCKKKNSWISSCETGPQDVGRGLINCCMVENVSKEEPTPHKNQ